MTTRNSLVPALLAAAAGAALWFAVASLTGKREPWDDSVYWTLAYPAAIGVVALLAYRYPDRPWRWALILFEAQFFAMCAANGELGNLWPLGMLLFAVIALPAILAAWLAAWLGQRSADEPAA